MPTPPENVETVMARCASTMDALLAGQIEPEQAHKIAEEIERLVRERLAELRQTGIISA